MSTNGAARTQLPRPRSSAVFDGPDRAHSRAYMKGIGFDDDALSRPTIGISRRGDGWATSRPVSGITLDGDGLAAPPAGYAAYRSEDARLA